jgi:hypothetical protein
MFSICLRGNKKGETMKVSPKIIYFKRIYFTLSNSSCSSEGGISSFFTI